MDNYFIIHNASGDTTVEKVTKKELLKRINTDCPHYGHVGFMDRIEAHDTNYWGGNILIIKGDIVVPKAVTEITEFGVE